MSRYYFDVHGTALPAGHQQGEVCHSHAHAAQRAAQILEEIAVRNPLLNGDKHLLVRNEVGQIVFRATLNTIGKWHDIQIEGFHSQHSFH